MPPTHHKLLSALSGVLLAGSAVVAAAVSSPPGQLPQVRPVSTNPNNGICKGYCKDPTNAGKVFRWGNATWRQEFISDALGPEWKSNQPDLISDQFGMLTLNGTQNAGTITVWPNNQAAVVGRWEARVRFREFGTKPGKHYRYTWELVPADGDTSCGANRIVIATFEPGDARVEGAVNTLPNHSFTYSRKRALKSAYWHAYAIEVTKKHISWFVDTKVIRTERRPAALSGVKFRPQFEMQAVPGATMKPSYMTMDWARYYTLKRPNAQSIKAPQMTRTTSAGSC